MEFQSLTGGGSVLWLKSSRCRSNVNKVVHDFVHHGDFVRSPPSSLHTFAARDW